MIYGVIIGSIMMCLVAARVFRMKIVRWLLKLRGKLVIRSLRQAIEHADRDKDKTGRKNVVVFNTHSGKYENLQKKVLKAAATVGKNKNNAALTEGRLRMMKAKKKRQFTTDRVRQIEKKSLYVTK